jgi:hypothetical protein
MELRPIPARDWADWYTQELCASFPACECKPLEAIRALAAEGRYELLGLYDGAALLGKKRGRNFPLGKSAPGLTGPDAGRP